MSKIRDKTLEIGLRGVSAPESSLRDIAPDRRIGAGHWHLDEVVVSTNGR
ncbi:hypothetical protein [Methylosinus sp. Sm6]|nr:hypothetical protein [Methylosinus sp. Sm6]MBY6243016.1 hypothetical protein [Methylosinus sp. Sm6]